MEPISIRLRINALLVIVYAQFVLVPLTQSARGVRQEITFKVGLNVSKHVQTCGLVMKWASSVDLVQWNALPVTVQLLKTVCLVSQDIGSMVPPAKDVIENATPALEHLLVTA